MKELLTFSSLIKRENLRSLEDFVSFIIIRNPLTKPYPPPVAQT